MTRIGAVLLTAGGSSRFGPENKLLAEIGGTPMVRIVAETLVGSARFEKIVVVTGHESQAIVQALQGLPVLTVFNATWQKGMGTSIAFGVSQLEASLEGASLNGAAIALGDMPFLSRELIEQLTSAFDEASCQSIVVPTTLAGEQRNPVIWPRRFFGLLEGLSGQAGGKRILKQLSDACVALPVTDDRALLDIDTPCAAVTKPVPKAIGHRRTGRRLS